MKALSTFKGVEGFISRGKEFETSERRASVLERKKLAEKIVPKENKMIEPSEHKDEDNEGKKAEKKGNEDNELLDKKKYKVDDLEEIAKLLEISGYSGLNKDELLKEVSEELLKREISNLANIDKEELIQRIEDKG